MLHNSCPVLARSFLVHEVTSLWEGTGCMEKWFIIAGLTNTFAKLHVLIDFRDTRSIVAEE
jgi:hypothetical protein